MPSKIILKKSSVATKAPVAGDLDFGELAINYTDSKLYFKKADGSIDAFTSAATAAPVTSVGGNIGDITDAQLLTSIKNVDGTGSGLDADFLDGNHASAFYLATNPSGYTSNTGTVTSVGATAPIVSSGGTTPSISIAAANSTTNGYMSSAYATKLDGIATGAQVNVATNLAQGTRTTTAVPVTSSTGTTATLDIATTLLAGVMSSADKVKLDGIAAGATANTGTVTGVTGTAPIVSSGGTAPAISIAAASSGVNGYMTGTYATKLDGIAAGATNVTNTNQLTNGAGYITSSGSITGSSGSVTGLTLTSSANGIDPNNVTQNQIGYNTTVSLFGQTDGGLYSSAYSSAWVHQIYGDFRTGQIAIRGKNSGTWQSWRTVLDSSNYTSYTPSLTGSGASGTWGINITGNAATATSAVNADTTDNLHAHAARNNEANKLVRTDINGYIQCGYINSSNGDEGNNSNPARVWGTNGSDNYMRTYLTSALSVNYATTAGSATYLNANNYIAQHGSDGSWNADFQNTPNGATRYNGDVGANGINNPGGSWWIQQNFRHTNASSYWGTQVAWGWEDNANRLATRNVQGGTFGGWVYYLNSSNYTSYTPSLTGSGASGTWGINITGNAATASNGGVTSVNGATGAVTIATGVFASGTAMMFVQTSAPTGWTKSTAHNNKALRVVSGTASSGGTAAFTTAFSSQTPSGTVGDTTLSTAQIPSHNHTGSTVTGGGSTGSVSAGRSGDIGPFRAGSSSGNISMSTLLANRTQGSGGEGGYYTITVSVPSHTHSISAEGGGGSHTHSFTGTAMNLAVQYVDVIIATKD